MPTARTKFTDALHEAPTKEEGKELLNDIAGFCNKVKLSNYFSPDDNDHLTEDPKTIEHNLCEWIQQSSQEILDDTIPKTFWDDLGGEPQKLSVLTPKIDEAPSVTVLLVVLWSRCSPKCSENIIRCLNFGARNWETDECFQEIDWLKTYVQCIRTCVIYNRLEIIEKAKEGSQKEEFAKSTTLLDACALTQAVSNSSAWFRLLTTKQLPQEFYLRFLNFFLRGRKLKSKFEGTLNDLAVFSDKESPAIKYVSVADWFENVVLRPVLRKMMKVDAMAQLASTIQVMRGEENCNSDVVMRRCQKLGDDAAKRLGLDFSGVSHPEHYGTGLLCVFAVAAHEFVLKENERTIPEETFMRSIARSSAFLGVSIGDEGTTSLLKDLMSAERPFMTHTFVCAAIALWGKKTTDKEASTVKRTKRKIKEKRGKEKRGKEKPEDKPEKPPKDKPAKETTTTQNPTDGDYKPAHESAGDKGCYHTPIKTGCAPSTMPFAEPVKKLSSQKNQAASEESVLTSKRSREVDFGDECAAPGKKKKRLSRGERANSAGRTIQAGLANTTAKEEATNPNIACKKCSAEKANANKTNSRHDAGCLKKRSHKKPAATRSYMTRSSPKKKESPPPGDTEVEV